MGQHVSTAHQNSLLSKVFYTFTQWYNGKFYTVGAAASWLLFIITTAAIDLDSLRNKNYY